MNTDALNTYEPLGLVCLSTRLTTAYTGEKTLDTQGLGERTWTESPQGSFTLGLLASNPSSGPSICLLEMKVGAPQDYLAMK